ncbi:MAG: hypothetical protein HY881_11150 [Deltaproteobacteria bacterium]|nr:hypothetical protein [Deltaproteobacteria bacterium]
MKEAAELAEFIRKSSSAGELLALADLEAEFGARTLPVSGPATEPDQFPALVQEAILCHNDIEVILDDSGGAWYFSERFMTGAYARVMLLKGQGPLKMMAEVIREHSRRYPRPVLLLLFQCHPFNLSNDVIRLCLKEMKDKPPYRDIAHLTTSIGNIFAYSTDHLDPDHAAMLAEWADVGQAENP